MVHSKHKILHLLLCLIIAITVTSCVGDLNTSPINPNTKTPSKVYQTPADFKKGLAKLYAGFATTGQAGPAGEPDIQGIDEGTSSYLRQYFTQQELPTDEVVNSWNDPGLPEFNYMNWGASNGLNLAMYDRIYYEIALANEFIRQAGDNDNPKVREYVSEARFIRALSYWNALDLYGGHVPYIPQDKGVGAYKPKSIGADSLFIYITDQLKDIAPKLPAPQQNEYGRADRAAAWTLLAKLYLNSKVYTGTPHYTQCITYTKKVIQKGGYQLDPNYQNLFLADNNTAKGIIFAITFDGTHTKTYGGTNYIIHAEVGGKMNASDFGIESGWAGNRVTPQFVNLFKNEKDNGLKNDSRALFFTDGQTKKVSNLHDFQNGYAVTKWKNITSDGKTGSKPAFADTDFPMFRLADVYLMYAEAVLRGGDGGSKSQALQYVNEIRKRAYGNTNGNITSSKLTLDFILDERGRELYWEAKRRTDLIRFGKFTGGNYLWSWKGKVQTGTATDSKYKLYPIPAAQLNIDTNLKQNPGY